MLSNLKIETRILIVFVLIALAALAVSGWISFSLGRTALETESFNKLTAVREMKADQIEGYFDTIHNQMVTFSEDRMIIEAARSFDEGLHLLDEEAGMPDADRERADIRLRQYYQDEFLERLTLIQ